MGLGTKIKTALSGHDHTTSSTSPSRINAPGAYPEDEVPQRHSDGREYVAPHGDLVNNKDKTGATSGFTSSGTQHTKLRREVDDLEDTTSSKPQHGHKTRDSGVGLDGHDQTTKNSGAYWGDLSHSNSTTKNTRELPDRSRFREETSTPLTNSDRHHDDSLIGGATGLSHSNTTRRSPDHSHFRDDENTGERLHDPRLMDQAVGGGVYDPNTSRGNNEHRGIGQSAAGLHDPLSSGSKSIHSSSGGAQGLQSRFDQDDINAFRRGDDLTSPSRHGTHGAHGAHGAGAGLAAGAGAAAAGYGVHEYNQRGHGNNSYGRDGNGVYEGSNTTMHQPAPGVPRSSMLDVDDNEHGRHQNSMPRSMLDVDGPSLNSNSRHHNNTEFGRQVPTDEFTRQAPHNNANFSSIPQPTGHHAGGYPEQGLSHSPSVNTNKRASSEYSGGNNGNGGSAFSGSQSGGGKSHFGPGHEGSKVLHTCEHCGKDNDISRYFSKDVVYRLGQ